MIDIIDDNINDLSGNSLFLLYFTAKWCGPCQKIKPMIQKLSEEVQDPIHIVPEDSKADWVRGGLPTRQMVRNADYLRRCQEKTVTSN